MIDLDLQGEIRLYNHNFIMPGLHTKHDTSYPSRLPRDPDCFTVSVTYIKLGSRGILAFNVALVAS